MRRHRGWEPRPDFPSLALMFCLGSVLTAFAFVVVFMDKLL